jgi:hypothetical protein
MADDPLRVQILALPRLAALRGNLTPAQAFFGSRWLDPTLVTNVAVPAFFVLKGGNDVGEGHLYRRTRLFSFRGAGSGCTEV